MSEQVKESVFYSDLQFCPMCGSVLPAPGLTSDNVPCSRCPFRRNIQEYHDVVEEFEIHYCTPKSKKKKKKRDMEEAHNVKTENSKETEFQGPTVERQCPRCSHDTMFYTTRQTRSADEGQTVFYTCAKCRFQDIEYS
ncbi:DNA-directed RNA polymerase subunit [Plakobranchus ocellatus]|uniref:DNA-directed RNA polymerase subunit n=1 Tax=Plakobranchus ocellatus TaxID=259542 RepID=A0AAV3ZP30_9GAST|nr:DNA-directed RNA polymerase subunit [Plakobranchus ocellatus]